jgi:hypothetical protein
MARAFAFNSMPAGFTAAIVQTLICVHLCNLRLNPHPQMTQMNADILVPDFPP